MKKGLLIAIDGPVASRKGTIAKLLAQKIHGVHLNTGATYRALAYKCIENDIEFNDKEKVLRVLGNSDIKLTVNENGNTTVFLDGINISEKIYTPEISNGSSAVALIPEVPRKMAFMQREIAKKLAGGGKKVIMEGRQIGTEVIPEADIKIFLSADVTIRAARRLEQYKIKGIDKSLDDEVLETVRRDEQDKNREFGALPKNPEDLGYFMLDNSLLSEGETLDIILT